MSFDQTKKSMDSILKLIDDNEKVALPIFSAKLSKASEMYPEDYTIGAMANIVARMGSNKLFITRAEVKDLYKRLHSRNTKFSSLFSHELGEVEKVSEPTLYNREHDDETLSIINKAYEKIVDPVLANALHGAFGNIVKGYTDTSAEKAKSVCARSILDAGIAANVDVVSGREDVIICRASFETPKGLTSVFVPIEIMANKVLLPTVFVGNNGPEDLTKENLESYIKSQAGNKLLINDAIVLKAMSVVKGEVQISNVDLAITKMNAQKEATADFSQGQVLYQKVDKEGVKDVVVPQHKDVESFAAQFNSSLGLANFKFTKEKVASGRTIISSHLSNFGLKNHQISVCDSNDSTIFYAVALENGKVAFRVPVKVDGGRLLAPTLIISNGSVEAFSKSGINNLFNKEVADYSAAAAASPLFTLKASELVEAVRTAVISQDYVRAEEALNVLAQVGDEKAYHSAFVAYTNGLGTKKVVATTKCSHIVKNSSSSHELCGHTGLPLHKVWQDKNNNCQPAYRKGMAETYEGGTFLTSKIFV